MRMNTSYMNQSLHASARTTRTHSSRRENGSRKSPCASTSASADSVSSAGAHTHTTHSRSPSPHTSERRTHLTPAKNVIGPRKLEHSTPLMHTHTHSLARLHTRTPADVRMTGSSGFVRTAAVPEYVNTAASRAGVPNVAALPSALISAAGAPPFWGLSRQQTSSRIHAHNHAHIHAYLHACTQMRGKCVY